MQNLCSSNVKVIFQRPSCRCPIVLASSFISGTAPVYVRQDYMEDNHGKEIQLVQTTVKIPGQRPRGSESSTSCTVHTATQPPNGHAGKPLDSSELLFWSCNVE